jgi:hypothetical protein
MGCELVGWFSVFTVVLAFSICSQVKTETDGGCFPLDYHGNYLTDVHDQGEREEITMSSSGESQVYNKRMWYPHRFSA